jgi:hypothetical protein
MAGTLVTTLHLWAMHRLMRVSSSIQIEAIQYCCTCHNILVRVFRTIRL